MAQAKNTEKRKTKTSEYKEKPKKKKTAKQVESKAEPSALDLLAGHMSTLVNITQESLETNKKVLEKLESSANIVTAAKFDPEAFKNDERDKPFVYRAKYVVQKYVSSSHGMNHYDDINKSFANKKEADDYGIKFF